MLIKALDFIKFNAIYSTLSISYYADSVYSKLESRGAIS